MRTILELALARARHQRARLTLAALAMVASSCVVVWVVSGYDALTAQFDTFGEGALGRYDLVVSSASRKDATLPASLVEGLRADPAVVEVAAVNQAAPTREFALSYPRLEGKTQAPVTAPDAAPVPSGALAQRVVPNVFYLPDLVGTDAEHPPYELVEGRWLAAGAPNEAVLTLRAARALGLKNEADELISPAKVGDRFAVSSSEGDVPVEVVGIVVGPRLDVNVPRGAKSPADNAFYVRPEIQGRALGATPEPNLIQVKLRPDADVPAFRGRWSKKLGSAGGPGRGGPPGPGAKSGPGRGGPRGPGAKSGRGRGGPGAKSAPGRGGPGAGRGGGRPRAVMVALNEVTENLDSGRAARSARGQAYTATGMALLAALFIIFATASMGVSESMRELAMLRAVGLTRTQIALAIMLEALLLGLCGWLGGLAAGWTLLQFFASPDLFAGGASLGRACVLLSGACAFGGALGAALIPAISAARIDPLEGLSRPPVSPPRRAVWIAGPLGLLLVAGCPVLLYLSPLPPQTRALAFTAIGLPALGLGLILLAPALVVLSERVLGQVTALAFGLEPTLLTTQLSANMGRSVGTVLALSVGLGLFIAMQAWGYSMLQPFLPGAWAPDAFVAFMSGGLSDEEVSAALEAPELDRARSYPLAVEQGQLATNLLGAGRVRSMLRQTNVIVAGIDPAAFRGGLELQWIEGSSEAAAAALPERGCVVPEHFAKIGKLSLGDSFEVKPPAGGPPVSYRVAGVVKLKGWHWMTKFSGARRRSVRAGAFVFADFATVRRDFGLTQVNFLWANLAPGKSSAELSQSLLPIAERNLGERAPVNGQGTWGPYAETLGNSLRVTTPELIEDRIGARSDDVIWGMSKLPLITLLITFLAVLNTMLASVRARRWDLGVLRAAGVTRSGLVRLVLAESLLVGCVACLLGLAAGLIGGWCGAGASSLAGMWGGMDAALVLPLAKVLPGLALTLLLCLVAGAFPALRIGRADVLDLLQAGRGGF